VGKRTWCLRDAKAHFSEVVNRAVSQGPQVVTRRGEEVVIVFAKGEFDRLWKSRPGLVRFFRESPLVGLDLDLERDRGLL